MKKIKLVLKRLLGFLIFTFVWWLAFAIIMFFDQGMIYDASNFIIIAVSALKAVFLFYGLIISASCLILLLVLGGHLMASDR